VKLLNNPLILSLSKDSAVVRQAHHERPKTLLNTLSRTACAKASRGDILELSIEKLWPVMEEKTYGQRR